MKAVMISIHPKWVEKIVSGEKTIEFRKTAPKLETRFKCYIYCTKQGKTFFHNGIGEKQCLFRNPDNGKIKFDYAFELMCCKNKYCKDNFLSGKVIGYFVCDKIKPAYECTKEDFIATCLSVEEYIEYAVKSRSYQIYAWHISDLKIFDKPKEISEFKKLDKDIFCGNCKHIVVPPNREPLSDCDRYCDKYNEDLVYYDWFLRFDKCAKKECFLTRPPQSWCYVEI